MIICLSVSFWLFHIIFFFFLSFSGSHLICPVFFLPFHPSPAFLFNLWTCCPLNLHHQLALWNRLFLKLSSRATPLSCTVTWWETPPQKSSGGTLRSTELIPSGSCGTAPVSGECPSTRPTVPTAWACWVSLVLRWMMLGRTSAEPVMTRDATTCTKIQPPLGSVLRPL